MENQAENYFDDTYELVKKYVDDKLLLIKIQAAKKTAKIISKVILIFIATILFLFIILFLGFMLAYFFAEKMNSNFYGFGVVAGIYTLLLVLFIIIYRNYFSGKIMDMIAGIFFENDVNNIDDDED